MMVTTTDLNFTSSPSKNKIKNLLERSVLIASKYFV